MNFHFRAFGQLGDESCPVFCNWAQKETRHCNFKWKSATCTDDETAVPGQIVIGTRDTQIQEHALKASISRLCKQKTWKWSQRPKVVQKWVDTHFLSWMKTKKCPTHQTLKLLIAIRSYQRCSSNTRWCYQSNWKPQKICNNHWWGDEGNFKSQNCVKCSNFT